MKLPIRNSRGEEGSYLVFDVEREAVRWMGPHDALLGAVAWKHVINFICAYGRANPPVNVRAYPRAPLALKVRYRTADGREMVSITGDVSSGGLFIESADPLRRGTELRIDFGLPNPAFESITAKARVVWAREKVEQDVRLPGMGVQFTDIAVEARAQIVEFVEALTRTRHAAV